MQHFCTDMKEAQDSVEIFTSMPKLQNNQDNQLIKMNKYKTENKEDKTKTWKIFVISKQGPHPNKFEKLFEAMKVSR